MPWQEESTMELRRQFIQDVQSGATPVTELCLAYQISRKTGYQWLGRYEAGGLPALADRSRRPQHSPTATPPELVQLLLAAPGSYFFAVVKWEHHVRPTRASQGPVRPGFPFDLPTDSQQGSKDTSRPCG